jgi:hypothetical protein
MYLLWHQKGLIDFKVSAISMTLSKPKVEIGSWPKPVGVNAA